MIDIINIQVIIVLSLWISMLTFDVNAINVNGFINRFISHFIVTLLITSISIMMLLLTFKFYIIFNNLI